MSKPSAAEFSKQGDQYLGVPYSKIDCQALFELMLKGVGINKDLPGSNSWIREMMKNGWVGTPEECKSKFGYIPDGAALFIVEQDGNEPAKFRGDGIGNASHIGVVTHRTASEMMSSCALRSNRNDEITTLKTKVAFGDGAIHSSSSRGCVATSKFADKTINGGWNRIGLWNRLSYGDKIDAFLNGGKEEEVKPMTSARVAGGNANEGVNMREKPSRKAGIIMKIPQNSDVELLSESDGWGKVRYNGKTGYVMKEFIAVAVSQPPDVVEIRPPEETEGKKPKYYDKETIEVDVATLRKIYDMIGDLLTTV